MTGRMDGVTLSMTRVVLEAQELQTAAQRATQLVELQQRETLRVEAENRLRHTRAMAGGAASRRAAAERAVEPVGARPDDSRGMPFRRPPGRAGSRREADAPPVAMTPPPMVGIHPSLGTRLDIRT